MIRQRISIDSEGKSVFLEQQSAKEHKQIEFPEGDDIFSVAFLGDGQHIHCMEQCVMRKLLKHLALCCQNSRLGIFNVAIPVIYGEGNHAVGRLLEHVLTEWADVTVPVWTRTGDNYNSCLPTDNCLTPPLILPLMEPGEVDWILTASLSFVPESDLCCHNTIRSVGRASVTYPLCRPTATPWHRLPHHPSNPRVRSGCDDHAA